MIACVTHGEILLRLLILLAVPLCVLGCTTVRSPKFKVDTRDEMHHAIVDAIPTGTSVKHATEIMESAGFDCVFIESGSFSEDAGIIGDERDYPFVKDARFLKCTRIDSTGMLTSNSW